MVINYSEFPEIIKIEDIYLYRSKSTLEIFVCKVIKKLDNQMYLIKVTILGLVTVNVSEILDFNPYSRLFKNLMKRQIYKNSREIRHILKDMGLCPKEFMTSKLSDFDIFDSDLKEKRFESCYKEFLASKDECIRSEGLSLLNKPLFNTTNLTLHIIYTTVCANGGMDNVINQQIWKRLFFPYIPKTNVSYTIRTIYKKLLYEFELSRRYSNEEKYNFNFKFEKNSHVSFRGKNSLNFCGNIIFMRNEGLNLYYIKFLHLDDSYNEWVAEDVLSICENEAEYCAKNFHKAASKSSKSNDLLDDPLTWEKHRHGFKTRFKQYTMCNEEAGSDEKENQDGNRVVEYDTVESEISFTIFSEESNMFLHNLGDISVEIKKGKSLLQISKCIDRFYICNDYELNEYNFMLYGLYRNKS